MDQTHAYTCARIPSHSLPLPLALTSSRLQSGQHDQDSGTVNGIISLSPRSDFPTPFVSTSNSNSASVARTSHDRSLQPLLRLHESQYSSTQQQPPDRVVRPVSPRAPSPDTLSRVSTSSAGPLLRKKPRTISINNIRERDASTTRRSPSLRPSLSQSDSSKFNLVSSQPSANSSRPLLRAASGSLHQSPSKRKPPASHSSYGVETTCGPPPSYSTQQTLSQERITKVDRNTIVRMLSGHDINTPTTSVYEGSDVTAGADATKKQEATISFVQSSPESAGTQSIVTPTENANMADVNVRIDHDDNKSKTMDDPRNSSSDERKSEDLFLNIARVDAARTVPKVDKRRSRISLPFLSSARSMYESTTVASTSSPGHHQYDAAQTLSPQAEVPRHFTKQLSSGQSNPKARSKIYLPDGDRLREHSVEPPSDHEKLENRHIRKISNTGSDTIRLSQRSSQALRGSRLVSESGYMDRSRHPEHVATESTVSTTAPSTVWDELDDLKSRIRKLELTGKLPPSSAAAMSSAERPRTATTAATTMSSSPKHRAATSTLQPTMEGISPNVHPLLHEALGNAKQVLSNDVYQKLYATAQDALQLSAMMSTDPYDNTNNSTNQNLERQLRRRTESMCRGLTELAISLTADTKPGGSITVRPVSRDANHPPNAMLRSRRYSNDTTSQRMSPRVLHSRLDDRRASLHLNQGLTRRAQSTSPDEGSRESPTELPPLSGTRLNRNVTVSHRRRATGLLDGADDDFEASPSIRPVSRAMTELGAYRRASRDHATVSRDYIGQHPVSIRAASGVVASTPLPSNMSTNFISRRKYASPGSVFGSAQESSPITPRDNWGQISVVPGEGGISDVMSEVNSSDRAASTRRSMGFASRIGSSVGSRLRAARAERSAREDVGNHGPSEVTASTRGNDETRSMARVSVDQTFDS